jgi:hypothetical protein
VFATLLRFSVATIVLIFIRSQNDCHAAFHALAHTNTCVLCARATG